MQLMRFTKFGLVGCTGVIIDLSITWICKEKLKWNKYISSSLGFSFAVVNNFLLNKYFTFHNTDPGYLAQFMRFFLLSLAGLGLSNLFLFLLQKYSRLNFYMAKLLVIGIVFTWNYFANSFFTFTQK